MRRRQTSTGMRVRGVLAATLALGAMLALASPSPAADPAQADALALQIAGPWPDLQNENGTFRDYVYGGHVSFCLTRHCAPGLGNARYGESVLGYAMLATGIRANDDRLIDSGLRALNFVTGRSDLQATLPTVFENSAVASAYNLAREQIPARPLFADHRAKWEAWLRRVKPAWVGRKGYRIFNHHMVDAIGILELARTGLVSDDPSALLSPQKLPHYLALTRKLVNSQIPALAKATTRSTRGELGSIVSDPDAHPISYHEMDLGLYARAVKLLGADAAPRALVTLRRMAHASWALMAPDGDVSYADRSQEDIWAPAATAYGAELAARLPGSDAKHDARYQALAERALGRLSSAYGTGPQGTWITPALRQNLAGGLRGIDTYAGAAAFAGIALEHLAWALEDGPVVSGPVGRLAADSDGYSQILKGTETMTFVRHGELWYAVKQGPSVRRHADDLRYDFGLVALKQRRSGVFGDLMPPRPLTIGHPDSAGPTIGTGKSRGFPVGTRTSATHDGVVTVTANLQTAAGRVLRRGVAFRYRPVSCGVSLGFAVKAGDRVEYSAFLRGKTGAVHVNKRGVSDATQDVTFSQPAKISLKGGYASGSDPRLVRARIVFSPSHDGRLAIRECRR